MISIYLQDGIIALKLIRAFHNRCSEDGPNNTSSFNLEVAFIPSKPWRIAQITCHGRSSSSGLKCFRTSEEPTFLSWKIVFSCIADLFHCIIHLMSHWKHQMNFPRGSGFYPIIVLPGMILKSPKKYKSNLLPQLPDQDTNAMTLRVNSSLNEWSTGSQVNSNTE